MIRVACAVWGALCCVATAAHAAAGEPLMTATAAYRDAGMIYSADGTVEAVKQSTVAAQISGRVVDIRFDVGDRVNKGEVIVRIDEREVSEALAASQAQLAQAQATLVNARAVYERTRGLFDQKFVSQAALDKALADYKAAQAQLEGATAAVNQAATVQGFATVTAPYSGVVAARHVELGETVLPGKPLMTGFDPVDLRVVADVPQQQIGKIGKGTAAVIELGSPRERVSASSITVLPAADARTHTTRVRLALPRYVPGSYPGMYARVLFVLGEARKLAIPAAAVVRRTELTAVYVVSEQGEVRFRQVRLGEAVGEDAVEVLAGLQAGEKVALDPVKGAMARKSQPRKP
jgi:RND family efflux transporter MFP subunit